MLYIIISQMWAGIAKVGRCLLSGKISDSTRIAHDNA